MEGANASKGAKLLRKVARIVNLGCSSTSRHLVDGRPPRHRSLRKTYAIKA